jgi:ABC-type nitrate/sulfonate/bicarbonate transport system permease component
MSGTLGIKLARFAIVLAVFVLWETLSRTGIVNPRQLPSASETLAMLGELLQRASLRNDLLVTASEVLTALVLAVPVGTLIGVLIAENR